MNTDQGSVGDGAWYHVINHLKLLSIKNILFIAIFPLKGMICARDTKMVYQIYLLIISLMFTTTIIELWTEGR